MFRESVVLIGISNLDVPNGNHATPATPIGPGLSSCPFIAMKEVGVTYPERRPRLHSRQRERTVGASGDGVYTAWSSTTSSRQASAIVRQTLSQFLRIRSVLPARPPAPLEPFRCSRARAQAAVHPAAAVLHRWPEARCLADLLYLLSHYFSRQSTVSTKEQRPSRQTALDKTSTLTSHAIASVSRARAPRGDSSARRGRQTRMSSRRGLDQNSRYSRPRPHRRAARASCSRDLRGMLRR
jgi:hypothetical protein